MNNQIKPKANFPAKYEKYGDYEVNVAELSGVELSDVIYEKMVSDGIPVYKDIRGDWCCKLRDYINYEMENQIMTYTIMRIF